MELASQIERIDTIVDTMKDLGLSRAERMLVLQIIEDSLHNQEYCIDDQSLRKAAVRAAQNREP